MRVLLVERNPFVAELLALELKQAAATVDAVGTLREAARRARLCRYDLAVIESDLVERRGDVLASLTGPSRDPIPLLVLPARIMVEGACRDPDCPAPRLLADLLTTVRQITPGTPREGPRSLVSGALHLDRARRVASVSGRRLHLTRTEFALLELFLERPGHVLSRSQILLRVWRDPARKTPNVVEVYVGRLRRKLGAGPGVPRIVTEHGFGYRLEPAPRGEHGVRERQRR